MKDIAVGTRVGAFESSHDGAMREFGLGTYEGDVQVPEELGYGGIVVPKIKLDNGDIIYGCECYWGPEESFLEYRAKLDPQNITLVTIAEYRQEAEQVRQEQMEDAIHLRERLAEEIKGELKGLSAVFEQQRRRTYIRMAVLFIAGLAIGLSLGAWLLR